MGLHDVRTRMAVIPQDSFVFSGSLAANLDPLGNSSREEILKTLNQVRFIETLPSDFLSSQPKPNVANQRKTREGKMDINMHQFETQETNYFQASNKSTFSDERVLDFEVEDGGKNLSLGQKQLICIARALIKKPQILLMDEATSNIDEYTDNIIQNVIKQQFRDSTISRLF